MYNLPKMFISMKSLPYHYLVMRVNGKKTGENKIAIFAIPLGGCRAPFKKINK